MLATPRGGLDGVLRRGPAAYGFAEGPWLWEDLVAYAQTVWGAEATPQVLHHRLRALGYASDGQHVTPQSQTAPRQLANEE